MNVDHQYLADTYEMVRKQAQDIKISEYAAANTMITAAFAQAKAIHDSLVGLRVARDRLRSNAAVDLSVLESL